MTEQRREAIKDRLYGFHDNGEYHWALNPDQAETLWWEILPLLDAEPPQFDLSAEELATRIGVMFLEYAHAVEARSDPRDEVATLIAAALRAEKARADLLELQYEQLLNLAMNTRYTGEYATMTARHVAERAALGRAI